MYWAYILILGGGMFTFLGFLFLTGPRRYASKGKVFIVCGLSLLAVAAVLALSERNLGFIADTVCPECGQSPPR